MKRISILAALLVCALAPVCRCLAVDAPAKPDAVIISDTLPVQVRVNTRLEVSVTVKNTGGATWNYVDEYRLGAIDDTDPFGPGRIDLSIDESVAPGAQKVFNFVVMAPSAPGMYTSDWQMLHENVCRFGEILIKKIEVTPTPPPPAQVTGLTAKPGDRQISLSWINPASSYFEGTMIRFKTTGYPSGIADGVLVTNRAASPGTTDSYVHTNLTNGVMYYYSAFPHNDVSAYNTVDSMTVSTAPSRDDVWMSQTFDVCGEGNLNGQGNWTSDIGGVQVQSAMANAGNALLLDSTGAPDGICSRYSGFAKRMAGTCSISFDAAQAYDGSSAKPFGTLVFYADDATEITRLNCAARSWRLEYGAASVAALSSSVTQNTWYNIKLTFDLSRRTIDAYVNGQCKATNLPFKAGSASNIDSIGVWSVPVQGLKAQKMYLDNLRGETVK